MLRSSPKLFSIVVLTLGVGSMVACGGSFAGGDDDTGGQAGSGGQTTGGSTGKAGSTGKGGSTGRGGSGSGGTGSGSGCDWLGTHYEVGDSFPAGDGCNTCSCGDDGSVGCTLAFCDQCSDIQAVYSAAIDEAKTCDPQAANQCTESVFVGLQCGCTSFVNPEQTDAIEVAQQAQQDYGMLSCGGDVLCAPCQEPTSAYCSAEGRCVDTFEITPGGASCLVNGTVYLDGTSGVPDPHSCNTCNCVNGELTGCTEFDCPVTVCPPDSVPSTQCAQCGPVDNCEIVEHGCLPVCTDTCQIGACLDGVCRMVCG